MSTEAIGAPGIITVNYGMSLHDMIAAGKYDWVDSGIAPAKFPVAGKGIIRFKPKLFHFSRYISSEDAVAAIEKEKFLPAKHEHGCAFGAANPDEQRKYPIACLGSSARVSAVLRVVCLGRGDAKRYLSLSYLRGDWDDPWRFLGVQEVSGA
jgi:hypothetical protein